MKAKEILKVMLDSLKQYSDTAAVEIKGKYFYGADIAIADKGQPKIYRITIIEHNQKRGLFV